MVKFHTKHKIGENIGRPCETISGTGQRTKAPPAKSATRSTHKLKKSAVLFRPTLIAGIAILTGSIAQAQQLVFSNPVDSNWQNGANWVGGTAPGFNATLSEVRLNINGGAITALNYTAAEGATILDVSPTGGQNRGIGIAVAADNASGIFNVTGGTLTFIKDPGQNAPLIIGAGSTNAWAGSAQLNVTGGLVDVGNGEISVLGRGTNTSSASMTVSGTGVVSADLVSFATEAATTGTGAINVINGGTLRTRSIRDRNVAANTTLNIDGGTIVSLDTNNSEEWISDDFDALTVTIGPNGATFDTNGQNDQRIAAVMGGTGGITKAGAGTMVLVGNNTYSGATHVNGGTLQIGLGATTGTLGTGAVSMAAGATLAIARTDNLVQSTFIGTSGLSGDGNFETKNSGIFNLDIANTFTGTTTVRLFAHLRVSNSNGLGTANGGTIVEGGNPGGAESEAIGASLQLEGGVTIANESLTIQGTGGSPNGLTAQRGALQSVSGSNTWAGPITITGNNTRIGIQNGADLTLSGPITDGGNGYAVILRGASDAAGTITISSTGNSWGQTKIFGSATRITVNDALPTAAPLFVGTSGVGVSIFDLNGFNQRVGGLSQINNTGGTITNNGLTNSTLTVDSISDQSFSGQLTNGSSPLSLVKEGLATQTLTGLNTYSGPTTVNNGALVVTGDISGSTATVNNGGTIGGTGTLGPVTVKAGGNFSPGLPNQIGTLFAGSLSLESNANFTLQIDSNLPFADVASVGDLTLAIGAAPNLLLTDLGGTELALGTTLSIISYSGTWNNGLFAVNGAPIADDIGSFALGLNKFTIDYNYTGNGFTEVALVVVPEPGSAALALAAFAGLLGLRRRHPASH